MGSNVFDDKAFGSFAIALASSGQFSDAQVKALADALRAFIGNGFDRHLAGLIGQMVSQASGDRGVAAERQVRTESRRPGRGAWDRLIPESGVRDVESE